MDSLYERYAAQLVRMAQHPCSKDYARERAKELEQDQYGLFQGIYRDVQERLKAGQARLTESEPLTREKLL